MEHILNSLRDNFQFSEAALNKLAPLMEQENYSKKELLTIEGKRNSNYYFITKGLARFYILPDGKEITNWFFKEGDIMFSMAGIYYNLPSFGYFQFLEDSEVYKVPSAELDELFKTDIELCNFSRKLYQKNIYHLANKHFTSKETSAVERYNTFCKENPKLLNRIGLGYLATYLGMTQVTLSRVRSQNYP